MSRASKESGLIASMTSNENCSVRHSRETRNWSWSLCTDMDCALLPSMQRATAFLSSEALVSLKRSMSESGSKLHSRPKMPDSKFLFNRLNTAISAGRCRPSVVGLGKMLLALMKKTSTIATTAEQIIHENVELFIIAEAAPIE